MTRPRAAALPLSFAAHGLALAAAGVLAVAPGDVPAVRAASAPPLDTPVLRIASPPRLVPAKPVLRPRSPHVAPTTTPLAPPTATASAAVPPPPSPMGVGGDAPLTGEPGPGRECLGCDVGRVLSFDDAPAREGEGPGGGPIRVGGDIREPRKRHHVAPVYPEIARVARVQGTVVVECTLTPEGRVAGARVVSGHALLNDAALHAVEQWLFTPTLLNGVAVPVILTVTVRFQLG